MRPGLMIKSIVTTNIESKVSGVMKKFLFLVLLVLSALVCLSQLSAQASTYEENLTIEQLQEEILEQKRQIRDAAKSFLVDELPVVIELDPQRANHELQLFSSTLSALGDEEISLLLGHMYARIGENDKAITIFDSLLPTELNSDARQMLNVVLYRRLVDLLEQGERESAREYLRHIIFDIYNTGSYFPAYLYVYADLSTDHRDYAHVLDLIDAYNFNRQSVLNTLLPAKKRVLDRIDSLDLKAYYEHPDAERFRQMSELINQIQRDLALIHSEMLGMQGMLFIDEVVEAHQAETEILELLRRDLRNLGMAEELIESQMQTARGRIEAVRENLRFYDRVLMLFDNHLQQNYLKLSSDPSAIDQIYAGDLYLDRIYQIDRTIAIYNEQLDLIDSQLGSGDFPEHEARLLEERSWILSEKQDAEALRVSFVDELREVADDDAAALLEILGEYNALVRDRDLLRETTTILEEYVETDVREMVSYEARGGTQARIQANLADLKDPEIRHRAIINGYEDYLGQIEFLSLHLSYRELMKDTHDYFYPHIARSDEEQEILRNLLLDRHIALTSEIEAFLVENPGYSSFVQPDGSNLITDADLYYKLGELKYFSYPADPAPALVDFQRAASLDPDFPNRDLALYNVAVISSELKRNEIDQNKIAFRQTARPDAIPPAASLYSEANFRQTLQALEEIIQNYPESQIHEESIYRLGLLYFRFADDSQDPDHYHALAIEQFDRIIESPQSPLYYEALYQRGWVRLNSFDEDDLMQAMDDNIAILKAIENSEISDPQLAADYQADAIDNIAYCLIALDGTNFHAQSRGVDEIYNVFGDYKDEYVIQQVIDKALENKLNMGVSVQAIDYMRLRLEHNPLALENPTLLDSMLVLYHNSGQRLREGENLDQITQSIYQELIDDYSPETNWYSANREHDIRPQMLIVDNAYEQRGIRLLNIFAANINRDNLSAYADHSRRYDAFARYHSPDYLAFSAASDSLLVNAYAVLADRTDDISDYLIAIEKLYDFNEDHPTNSQFYDNEELAMNYSRNIYAQVSESLADLSEDGSSRIDEAFDFLKNSAERFILVSNNELHSSPQRRAKALDIILLMGDIQMGRRHLDDAAAYYTRALEQEELLSNADKRDSYLKLAEISMQQNRHSDAESWLRLALPLADSQQEQANINQDILVQIQSSFESASDSGDYLLEAEERLRLADALDPSRSSEILGHRVAAVDAYINAREYQLAIDLLMVIAASDTNIDAVYARYNRAYEIAHSEQMMNDPALADSIEQEFIDLYPASNYSFRLRLAKINDSAETDPATAATEYLALFEEVQAGEIDPGDLQASDLLADAILMYARSNDISTEYELRYRFIELYPEHQNVIPYLEYMAKGHLDRDEMDEYTAVAREILRRSPDKSTYYQFVADTQLQRIAGRFDTAYLNQEYEEALIIRDEYLAAEAGYIAEGLSFANDGVHEVFAAVQAEYDGIQARNEFLARYDERLTELENSTIFRSTPAQQIRVVAITTWDRNLNGGDARIPRYRETIANEVAKVTALVREANETGYYINNERRLRAMDLIWRFYERGAEVVSTQLEQYFRITNEAAYYRDQYPGEALNNVIAQFNFQQTQDYLNNAVSWQFEIFRQYQLAGYESDFTISASEALAARGLLAEYREQEYVFDNSWNQVLNPSSDQLSIQNITSPKGQSLGSAMLPAGNTLEIQKDLDLALEPDFAYLNIVFPLDIRVMLNGTLVNSSWVPIDSLEAGKALSTRYSYMIPGELFEQGENKLIVEVINDSSERLQMALAIDLMTSEQRILANIPPETKDIYSGTDWKLILTDPDTGESSETAASHAAEWNISWEQIVNMEPTAAEPIWASELTQPVDNPVFETEFVLDTPFIEGMIDLVAPESVRVYLNGTEIGSSIFDYDPDPLQIYKGQILIPAQNVVEGRNVLRFEVQNGLPYRGFLAHITYTQTGKEAIR